MEVIYNKHYIFGVKTNMYFLSSRHHYYGVSLYFFAIFLNMNKI